MAEYRRKISGDHNEELPSQQAYTSPSKAPRYMELTSKYGLDDDLDIRNLGPKEQTVYQEYQAYVTAPSSDSSTDILKFWEVGAIRDA
jgi:hypothetical protein